MADATPMATGTRRWLTRAQRGLFGPVQFSESEEYHAFRYKLLVLLMVSGAVFTALFIAGNATEINPIEGLHRWSMLLFTAGALFLWLWLRGDPRRFWRAAWAYEALCLAEYTSALVFVPFDELRILWFYVNVPGVFIMLGQRAGWAITLGTAVGLAVGNAHLAAPYSGNAMATAVLSLLYLGFVFHAYVDRSLSFFARMRVYNRELQQLASRDPLTGVMNARAYYAACDQQIRLGRRNRRPFAVLFVDLDHFKRINDTWGHEGGDRLLVEFAHRLQACVRRTDTVARIAGDEFVIILEGLHAPAEAATVAAKIVDAMRVPVQVGEGDVVASTTIGIAVRAQGETDPAALLRRADAALYAAKAQGRGRYLVAPVA